MPLIFGICFNFCNFLDVRCLEPVLHKMAQCIETLQLVDKRKKVMELQTEILFFLLFSKNLTRWKFT